MAKLKDKPITASDITEYVQTEADFAFEMRVLSRLEALEFRCEHGGTYRDPITDKIREFDIRARLAQDVYRLALAVECKNIRSNFPLLVHAIPRNEPEAYHEVVVIQRPLMPRVRRVIRYESFYRPDESVGKQTDQIGRKQSGDFVVSDAGVFEKISQSISSSYDLVKEAAEYTEHNVIQVVLPILVVPDESLWQVDYSAIGDVVEGPRTVPRASLFLDHTWTIVGTPTLVSYTMSHLEIVTFSALEGACADYRGTRGLFALEHTLFQ